MKKIISLLLCLVMVALTLASCSGNAGTTSKTPDRPNLTLKVAVVVSDETTEEGVAAMEKAFNAKSTVSLNTKVDFVWFKASEYEDKIEAEMERLAAGGVLAGSEEEDNKANGTGTQSNLDADEYPIPQSKQFDIVLITSEDMYVKFVERGWIKSLQSSLDGLYQKLKTKVIDKAMAYTLINEECYAIPTAKAYGSYTYLSINKKVADFYNWSPADFEDVNSVYSLFKAMEIAPDGEGLEKWQNAYGDSFAPVLNDKDGFIYSNAKYFSIDGNFSLIGTTHKPNASFTTWSAQNINTPTPSSLNILENEAYKTYLTMKFDFDKKGYFGTGAEKDYIVGVVKGDYSLRNSDPENYYYIPVTMPEISKEEVFSSMLAVSSFSVDTTRSVEIIQEFMTDDTKSGLLNIALYGAENENYYLDDGVVNLRESHNYAAHPDYLFGNLNETAYPCFDYGQTASTYTDGLLQNRDLPQKYALFNRADLEEGFYAFTRPAGWEDWKEGDPYVGGAETIPAAVVRSLEWAKVSEYSKAVLDSLMGSEDMDAFFAAYDAQLAAMNDPETTDEDILLFNRVKGKNLKSDEIDTITYAIASGYKDVIEQK